ncbi:hypothetical protein BpHYR1_041337 [Brachionus plicatilis]|uniref:Uncharacterized protein n=1 Tax=Brachionus plicatilis TaxID=10195 RepID=A0A3M7PWM7_BRAPC|nr:hypothetical protein BpHYR1_041337 [Brachionus plicatilis]
MVAIFLQKKKGKKSSINNKTKNYKSLTSSRFHQVFLIKYSIKKQIVTEKSKKFELARKNAKQIEKCIERRNETFDIFGEQTYLSIESLSHQLNGFNKNVTPAIRPVGRPTSDPSEPPDLTRRPQNDGLAVRSVRPSRPTHPADPSEPSDLTRRPQNDGLAVRPSRPTHPSMPSDPSNPDGKYFLYL